MLIIGVILRRILRLGEPTLPQYCGMIALDRNRELTYDPVAREIETHTTILGVSLNDAIEERDSGNREVAWRLARLAGCEWERLSGVMMILLNSLTDHLPEIHLAFPIRRMSSSHFKSRTMIDYVRMHELLSQFVFRPRLRFQLQLRVLRRAVETLTSEFQRECNLGERSEDSTSLDCWRRLDIYFHDFDLITKETLLAFRAFLVCLPDRSVGAFAVEVQAIVHNGVRSKSVTAGE
ncbi:MAG: hypothetical protein ACRD2O_01960 [Terriglobia bacterium]